MAPISSQDNEIKALKSKLESAIKSRADLQSDFQYQTELLTNFISKLSLATKGLDVLLDNKLALFRGMLNKSASISDIEKLIGEISQILRKNASNNERNIIQLHEQLQVAGKALQKIQGLPDDVRKPLRKLVKETQESKDAVVQYLPLLSELLTYYQAALKSKSSTNSSTVQIEQSQIAVDDTVDSQVLERFNKLLSSISVSTRYKKEISKIKEDVKETVKNDELLDYCLTAFDVIRRDLAQERNTAKVFLSTLSDTLATVQSAVQTTIATNQESQTEHNRLNDLLQEQISRMSSDLDQAASLAELKVDISSRLQEIASTLEQKATFESKQTTLLNKQLLDMQDKVEVLEAQSKTFEKRIQEQQAKSMQDALTKLANRAAFDDYFAKQMVRFHHKQFDLAIAVIDLDDFKRINDTFGHTAGDKTLQVVANTLKSALNGDAFVARYGGEEFVAIFTGFTQDEVQDRLETLRKKAARLPFKFKNNKVTITLSIGVTHVVPDDNVHIAFERADMGLYKAKEQGKNRIIYM